MRYFSLCLITLTLLTAATKEAAAQSDSGLSYLEAANRFGDLAAAVENRLARGEVANSTLLGPLCIAYANLKRYAALFECTDKLDARVRGGDTRIKSDYLGGGNSSDATALPGLLRAQAFLELGDYGRSIDEGRRALAIAPTSRGWLEDTYWPPVRFQLTLMTNIAIAAALSRKEDLAKEYREKLENFSVGIMGSAIWKPMHSNSLARVYLANGLYDKVVEQLAGGGGLRALVLGLASAFVTDRGDSLATMVELPKYFMLAKAQFETGKMAEAKDTFGKLLDNKRLPEIGEIHWLSLYERGRISAAEGDASGAIDYWRKAVEVIEEQRASIDTEASKIGFVGDKQAVYAQLIGTLIAQGKSAEAFEYVERSKSRALVDMLASKKDFAAQDSSQALVALAQLDAAGAGVRAQYESQKTDTRVSGVRNLQLARQALQSVSPELTSLVTVTAVPSAELKALIGPDETLVEYYYQGGDMYAFILDRERLLAIRLDVGDLHAQVQGFRAALTNVESSAWEEYSVSLYRRIWRPLQALIRTTNIAVVAHGVLHYLPFAAMRDAEGKFLVDNYSIRFLPSASILKYLRPALQKKEAQLLAIGNPDLDDSALDLRFAEGEAKLVASLFPNSRLLLRKEASESTFKKIAGLYSRLHFASHGKFQTDEPLKSGLYLAKDADNDGVLTASELYSMHMDADLVTLSACETGLGKIANGDDVIGLTRGFLYAGSRSIVASLWSVDDKATAALMGLFYGNLVSLNKREALRQAQIKTRETFSHPFYWSPFQLTGRAD